MFMKLFSIYDKVAEVYTKPFVDVTIGSAIRNFTDAARDEATQFNKHPADYNLFLLGEFDDNTGEIVNLDPSQDLGSCLENMTSEPDQ